MPRRLLSTLAIAALLAGCSSPSSTVADTVQVPPGGFAEVNLRLEDGGQATWDWSTAPARDVRFNVHSHSQGAVMEHLVLEADHHAGSFSAPEEGAYSLLWENPGPSGVSVTYSVRADGQVVGTEP